MRTIFINLHDANLCFLIVFRRKCCCCCVFFFGRISLYRNLGLLFVRACLCISTDDQTKLCSSCVMLFTFLCVSKTKRKKKPLFCSSFGYFFVFFCFRLVCENNQNKKNKLRLCASDGLSNFSFRILYYFIFVVLHACAIYAARLYTECCGDESSRLAAQHFKCTPLQSLPVDLCITYTCARIS